MKKRTILNSASSALAAASLPLAALLTLAAFAFAGCGEKQDYMPKPRPTEAPAVQSSSYPSGNVFIGEKIVYTGEGEHVYIHDDERDRKWEEDIVYTADYFLDPIHGHPKLTDKQCVVNAFDDSYSFYAQDTERVNLYDPELREEFIRRINELILNIPDMSNGELYCALQEPIAMLHDAMSSMYVPASNVFMLELVPVYTDDKLEICVQSAEKTYEKCLGAKLTAINGVETNEILDKLRPIISYENESGFISAAVSPRDGSYPVLLNCFALIHAGIIGSDDVSASFTFLGEDGSSFDINIGIVKYSDLGSLNIVHRKDGADDPTGIGYKDAHREPYFRPTSEESYWYEFNADSGVMYVRFNAFPNTESDLSPFMNELSEAVGSAEGMKKLALDLRGCRFGHPDVRRTLINGLNGLDFDGGVYVLIDGGTHNPGCMFASLIRRFVDGAVLVGTTAGYPIFGSFEYAGFNLPNMGPSCFISGSAFINVWPDSESDFLEPDIPVSQTYEDFLNGTDSVLKAVYED